MNLFTNGMEVFGNFGIYPVLDSSNENTGDFCSMFDAGDTQIDAINYLQKGEKILTLLRKKKQKALFSKDEIMEMVKDRWDLTLSCVVKNVAAGIEDMFLKTMNEDLDNEECILDACQWLQDQLPKHLFVSPEYRIRERQIIKALCDDKQQSIINIRTPEEDMILPVGATFKLRYEGGAKLRSDKGCFMNVKNFKRKISELVLRKYVLDRFKTLRLQGLSEADYRNLRVVGVLLSEYGLVDESLDYSALQSIKRDFKGMVGLIVLYPETKEAEEAVLELGCHQVYYILSVFSKEYKRKKDESKMEKMLSGDYARSFETKKNIPQKCVNAMARSGFNKFFGYVEFDEECDLDLMEELYREYEAFSKELCLKSFPEVSLRFRKLGNHKATGLYYYILKCLCVDVRYPGAFVHEVGHAIDYHLDHISDKYFFSKIAERYESLLKSYVQKGKKEDIAVLKGKTKYNLQYYLMPTEIFARCFEMYVVRIRKIDNSLCKPDGGFSYPEDEKLMEMITLFFDEILCEESR